MMTTMVLDVVALHVRLLLTLTHAEPEASSYPSPAAAALAGVQGQGQGRGVSAGGNLFNGMGAFVRAGAFNGMVTIDSRGASDGMGAGSSFHEGLGRADERAVLALVSGALMRKVLQAAGGWTPLAVPLGLAYHDNQFKGQGAGQQGDKGQGKAPPPLLRLEVSARVQGLASFSVNTPYDIPSITHLQHTLYRTLSPPFPSPSSPPLTFSPIHHHCCCRTMRCVVFCRTCASSRASPCRQATTTAGTSRGPRGQQRGVLAVACLPRV